MRVMAQESSLVELSNKANYLRMEHKRRGPCDHSRSLFFAWYFIKVRFPQEKNKLNVKKRCDIIKSAFYKFIKILLCIISNLSIPLAFGFVNALFWTKKWEKGG